MKIWTLTIKTGYTTEPSTIVSSYRSSPSAEKTEYFKDLTTRNLRRAEIEEAVDKIGLCAWLVSLENGEMEIK